MSRRPAKRRRGRRIQCVVENHTAIPNRRVRRILRHVLVFLRELPWLASPDRKRLVVEIIPMIAKKQVLKGFYWQGRAKCLVSENLKLYPCSAKSRERDPEFTLHNPEECLVAILAHELAHWMGLSGRRDDEFLVECISSACVSDWKERRLRKESR